jgi:hypothetical protein
MAKPINQRYNESVILDASGNGSVQITMRADFVLQRTRWTVQGGSLVNGAVKQSTAENSIDDQPFEGTQSGNNDQSNSGRLLTPQNTVTCEWTAGPPGGTATLYLWGVEYPAGQGIPPPAAGQGPGNPILGGNTLIRDAIQSSDFVAGSAGWAIFTDGSYEFGPGGTFRGNITVAGTDGSKVEIDSTGGHAEIDLTPPTYTDPTIINIPAQIGAGKNGVGNGSFGTLDFRSPNPLKPPLTTNTALISLQSSTLDGTFPSTIILQAGEIDLGTGGTVLKTNGHPLPGTWIAGAGTQADLAGVVGSGQVIQLTATDAAGAQPTFLANSWYTVVIAVEVDTTAVAAAPTYEIHKTNPAGNRFTEARIGPTVAAFPYKASFVCEFQVGGGSQAADIVLTLGGAAGQTVRTRAAADRPGTMSIYYQGPTPLNKTLYLPVL